MSRSRAGVDLAITASGTRVAVAARGDDGAIVAHAAPAARGGADTAQLVARAVADLGATPADLRSIGIDRGPGSYTGLRVALTFARTIGAFRGVALRTCTSMELLALRAWRAGEVARTRAITIVLDARREHFHVARCAWRADRVVLESFPVALRVERALATLDGASDVVAAASLHPILAGRIAKTGAALHAVPELDATLLFDPALELADVVPEAVEPLYLLASYAEA